MKHPVSLALAMLLLLTAVGCGNTGDNGPADTQPKETAPVSSETEPVSAMTTLPQNLDFEGAPFRIFASGKFSLYADGVFLSTEENGDIINDTAVRANKTVEDLFNVNIEFTTVDANQISGPALNTIMADEDAYDYLQFFSSWEDTSALMTAGALYNILDLPYLHLDQPYYFTDLNDMFEINDQLYFACSQYIDAGQLPLHMAFNKNMMQDFDLELPYQAVFDGKWTFDRFLDLIKDTSADLNGDGVMDWDDQFGYANNALTSYFLWSFDLDLAKRTSDGTYVPDLQNEKMIDAMTKVLDLWANKDVMPDGNSLLNADKLHHFMTGRSLFTTTGTGSLNLRGIEDFDFGILPLPKYDEQQEDYVAYTCPHQFGIPATIKDPEKVGAVVEALSIYYMEEMQPAFLDIYVETKLLRDEESIEVARILMNCKPALDITRYYKCFDSISATTLMGKIKNSGEIVSKLAAEEPAAAAKGEEFFSLFFK